MRTGKLKKIIAENEKSGVGLKHFNCRSVSFFKSREIEEQNKIIEDYFKNRALDSFKITHSLPLPEEDKIIRKPKSEF